MEIETLARSALGGQGRGRERASAKPSPARRGEALTLACCLYISMLATLSSSRPSQSGRPSLMRTIIVNFTMVKARDPTHRCAISDSPLALLFSICGGFAKLSIFPFGNLCEKRTIFAPTRISYTKVVNPS